MTMPRQIVAGRTYMVTRRCTERRFFMRPDELTTAAFNYCLAVAANLLDIGLVAFIANSNHYHAVLVDRIGRLPEFLHYFHSLFARHQNCLRGRWENFWASEQTSVVELVDLDDVIDKIAYALANPVKDHLVEKAHHWPGASALAALRHDRVVEAARPRHLFREEGEMPDSAALTLCMPPGLDATDVEQFISAIESKIADIELAAADERRADGTRILGRKTVLEQHWNERP